MGVDIRFEDVRNFYLNLPQSMIGHYQATKTANAALESYRSYMGAVGTYAAKYFSALNSQRIKEFTSFTEDARKGQLYLGNAVGQVGIEYSEGDVTSGAGVSSVVDGILNPPADAKTMREAEQSATTSPSGGGGPYSSDPKYNFTMDEKGNVVNGNGEVVVKAGSNPGAGYSNSGSTPTNIYTAAASQAKASIEESTQVQTGIKPGEKPDPKNVPAAVTKSQEATKETTKPSDDWKGGDKRPTSPYYNPDREIKTPSAYEPANKPPPPPPVKNRGREPMV